MTNEVLDAQLVWHEDDRFRGSDGVEGIVGSFTLGPHSFAALGRGDGYKRMRPGYGEGHNKNVFRCHTKRMVNGTKALWVPYPSTRRMYMHPANKPSQLQGCTALGMGHLFDGIRDSNEAFSDLWEAMLAFYKKDSWEEGLKLDVHTIFWTPSSSFSF